MGVSFTGFPDYDDWLFVTAKNKPPFITPVSQGRQLKAYMAHARQQMAQADAGNLWLSGSLATYNSDEMKKCAGKPSNRRARTKKIPRKRRKSGPRPNATTRSRSVICVRGRWPQPHRTPCMLRQRKPMTNRCTA